MLPAQVTIVDADTLPGIALTVSPTTASEATSRTITVRAALTTGATFVTSRTVTVTVGAAGDGADSGDDYDVVTAFPITIAAGASSGSAAFTLTAKSDLLVEGDETITVSGRTTDGLTVGSATLTLRDAALAPGRAVTLVLTVNPTTVSEGAARSIAVRAALSDPGGGAVVFQSTQTVAVTVGAAGDGADLGDDYPAVSGVRISIAAGRSTGAAAFTLDPPTDAVIEGDETVTVGGALTLNGGGPSIAVRPAQVTIVDADTPPGIVLSVIPTTASEATSRTITVRAALTTGATFVTSRTVTVTVGAAGDGADSGADYDAVTGFPITIAAGASSGSAAFTLTAKSDLLVEGDETITVSGSTTDGLTVGSATLILRDAALAPGRAVTLVLTVDPNTVSEGAARSIAVRAALSDPGGGAVVFQSTQTVKVEVGASGDGAEEGTDYQTVADFTVTVPALASSATRSFTLNPPTDDVVEEDETVTVGGALTLNGGGPSIAVRPAQVTIVDADTLPGIVLSVSPTTASEATSRTITVRATLTTAITFVTSRTVTVTVGAAGDGADSGADYDAVTDFPITIAAGASSGSAAFTLTAKSDLLVEGDETITVSGSTTDLTVGSARLTLHDAALAALAAGRAVTLALAVSPNTVSEGEARSIAVRAALNDPGGGAVVFQSTQTVTVRVGAAGDGADSGDDYPAVSGVRISIAAGRSTGAAAFTLDPPTDDVIEEDETVTVGGALKLNGGVQSIAVRPAQVTIVDADTPPGIVLSVSPTTASEATSRTITVRATLTTGATFAADKTVTVTVRAPLYDVLVEGDETVTVTASRPTVISRPASSISLMLSGPLPRRAAGPAASGAHAPRPSGPAAGAWWAVPPVPVPRTAASQSGDDYDAVTDFPITIAAGASSGSAAFTLTAKSDLLVEGDETIIVSGSTTDGLTVDSATLTLHDAALEPGRAVTLALAVSPTTVSEGAARSIAVRAALNDPGGGAVVFQSTQTVAVTVGAAGDGADSGDDYPAVSGVEISIAAGRSTGAAAFTLDPPTDAVIEEDETVTVGGALTLNGSGQSIAVRPAQVTIVDADTLPGIVLSVNPSTASEATSRTITVRAALTTAATFVTSRTVTVTVGAAGDGADSGADYDAVTDFPITVAAGTSSGSAAFTLTVKSDLLVEGDETITVSGSTTDGRTVDAATLTLRDAALAPGRAVTLALAVSPTTVSEGAARSIAVRAALSDPGGGAVVFQSTQTVTVTVGAAGDAATEGTDYRTVAAFTVTVPALASSATGSFTLNPPTDAVVEGDETVTVGGALTLNGGVQSIAVRPAQVTIVDADTPPGIVLSVSPTTASEATSRTITVRAALTTTMTFATSRTVTVTVGRSTDVAAEGTDYRTVADFGVTVAAGAASATGQFTLTPVDDTRYEGDETITVSGAAAGLSVTAAVLTLLDADVASGIDLTLNPTSVAENATTTTITVRAALTTATTFAALTTWTVTVGTAGDGAVAGTDYREVADFVMTLAADATSTTGAFTLAPVDDSLHEGPETVTVSGPAIGTPAVGSALLTLADDDPPPPIDLTLNPTSVAENATTTTITVTATLSDGVTLPYPLRLTARATTGTAEPGLDYVAAGAAVIDLAAERSSASGTFRLRPIDDDLVEGRETIIVVVRTTSTLTTATATLTMDDDERPNGGGTPGVPLELTPPTIAERGGVSTVTAVLTAPAAEAVTVAVTVTPVAPAREADYVLSANRTLTIPAGRTTSSGAVTITAVDDDVDRARQGADGDRQRGRRRAGGLGGGDADHRRRRTDAGRDAGTGAGDDRRARRGEHGDRAVERQVQRGGDGAGDGDAGGAGAGVRRHREREPHADHRRAADHQQRRGDDHGGGRRRGRRQDVHGGRPRRRRPRGGGPGAGDADRRRRRRPRRAAAAGEPGDPAGAVAGHDEQPARHHAGSRRGERQPRVRRLDRGGTAAARQPRGTDGGQHVDGGSDVGHAAGAGAGNPRRAGGRGRGSKVGPARPDAVDHRRLPAAVRRRRSGAVGRRPARSARGARRGPGSGVSGRVGDVLVRREVRLYRSRRRAGGGRRAPELAGGRPSVRALERVGRLVPVGTGELRVRAGHDRRPVGGRAGR